MDDRPLGALNREDPLLAYLRCHILPQLGFTVSHPRYEVFRFSDSRDLYLYVEKQGGPRLVGKFFQGPDPIQARKRGETECNNLLFLRESGLSGWPHRVTRPFGFNPEINNLLVVEYVAAEPLSDILEAGMQLGPQEVVMVGNDIYHDVFGAKQLGIRTVFFSSNQGTQQMNGVEADYNIYQFGELRRAIAFLERQ
jgi:hypothetical protein